MFIKLGAGDDFAAVQRQEFHQGIFPCAVSSTGWLAARQVRAAVSIRVFTDFHDYWSSGGRPGG